MAKNGWGSGSNNVWTLNLDNFKASVCQQRRAKDYSLNGIHLLKVQTNETAQLYLILCAVINLLRTKNPNSLIAHYINLNSMTFWH